MVNQGSPVSNDARNRDLDKGEIKARSSVLEILLSGVSHVTKALLVGTYIVKDGSLCR